MKWFVSGKNFMDLPDGTKRLRSSITRTRSHASVEMFTLQTVITHTSDRGRSKGIDRLGGSEVKLSEKD